MTLIPVCIQVAGQHKILILISLKLIIDSSKNESGAVHLRDSAGHIEFENLENSAEQKYVTAIFYSKG